jgi:cell division protein DivIC
LTIIGIFVIVTTLFSLNDVLGKRGIVDSRNSELEAAKKENARLKKQLVIVKSEGFVEQEARNKLGLVKSGEVVVVVPMQETPLRQGYAGQSGEAKSNWRQWWELFF